jgi:hypothetical protein
MVRAVSGGDGLVNARRAGRRGGAETGKIAWDEAGKRKCYHGSFWIKRGFR